jgi:hypothetical protein
VDQTEGARPLLHMRGEDTRGMRGWWKSIWSDGLLPVGGIRQQAQHSLCTTVVGNIAVDDVRPVTCSEEQ